MDTEEMQRQLQALTDRAEITDLMDRYLRSLDDGVFDEEWARASHTEDDRAWLSVTLRRVPRTPADGQRVRDIARTSPDAILGIPLPDQQTPDTPTNPPPPPPLECWSQWRWSGSLTSSPLGWAAVLTGSPPRG
ncbi:hypothetical protein [Streptomyces sp. NPDC051452]|uniref:hypothetical protein n=1 Tax=Streptomyces sp. NPDC051452 TaxID=3365654 RepID=UPI00378FA901